MKENSALTPRGATLWMWKENKQWKIMLNTWPVLYLTNQNAILFSPSDVNDCAGQPCKNGGVCRDLEGDFNCKCPSPYVGKHCHLRKYNGQSVHCKTYSCLRLTAREKITPHVAIGLHASAEKSLLAIFPVRTEGSRKSHVLMKMTSCPNSSVVHWHFIQKRP